MANVNDAHAACTDGADYLGAGPVFDARDTKPDAADPIGLEGLAAICSAVELPIIAIGGINAANARQAVNKGVAGVAVISAIISAADIAGAVRALKSAVEDVRRKID